VKKREQKSERASDIEEKKVSEREREKEGEERRGRGKTSL